MMRSSEDNKADYEGSSNKKATRREENLRQVNIVDAGQILNEEEEECVSLSLYVFGRENNCIPSFTLT